MREGINRRTALKIAAAGTASGLLFGGASADDRPQERIVGTTGPSGSRAARGEAASVRKTLDFGDIGQAVSGRFSDEAVARLEQRPDVRYVEDNGRMYAMDQVTPYGIEITDADVAIDDGHTGNGVSIAILDTGIDAQHETLEENLGEGWAADEAECTTDCGGGPFGGGNDIEECLEEWDDDNDHGSHCAGTAAAADNGVGVLGVAPDATLHAVKVLQCDGGGSFDDVAEGIEWSADQGHEVQSMSLGSDSDSEVVSDAIEFAAERNVVIVASAGNDGPCNDCVGFPARHHEVIAVSATDEDDDLADFSSTGPEVELAAPGVDVLSSIPRDDYDEFSGTSMSCPHVSGAAATVIADGTTDREDVRAQLKEGADDIGLDDNEQGAGRLNVADAVDAESGDDKDDEEDDDDDGEDDEETTAPVIDQFDLTDTSNPRWARVEVDWAVSDDDGNLEEVRSVLNDGVDSETSNISGSSASGTHELRERDGHGEAEVTLTVTDTDGNEASDTETITLG